MRQVGKSITNTLTLLSLSLLLPLISPSLLLEKMNQVERRECGRHNPPVQSLTHLKHREIENENKRERQREITDELEHTHETTNTYVSRSLRNARVVTSDRQAHTKR